MHFNRLRTLASPTAFLWLLVAVAAGFSIMNWLEHDRGVRQYAVDDDLPRLLHTTVTVDSSGTFYRGLQPVPQGLLFSCPEPALGAPYSSARLCDLTGLRIVPALWNRKLVSKERSDIFAWLGELKMLPAIRFSYPAVKADDLAALEKLPLLANLAFDYPPTEDEAWQAIGRLEHLTELAIGKPDEPARPDVDWGSNEPIRWPFPANDEDPPPGAQRIAAQAVASRDEYAHFGLHEVTLMHGLPRLRTLSLRRMQINDGVCERLASLEVLNISHCKMSAETLKGLAGCRKLTQLQIDDTPLGALGAAQLAAMPRLQTLSLCDPLTDEELQAIGANRTIANLEIDDSSRLSPQGLAGLRAVPIARLKIRVSANDAAEPFLAALRQVRSLRVLRLDTDDLNRSLVRGLSRLDQLEHLIIDRDLVSPQQINRLASATPKMTVHLLGLGRYEPVELLPVKDTESQGDPADALDRMK